MHSGLFGLSADPEFDIFGENIVAEIASGQLSSENRIYRYNYFYDNCTTRARDQIEKSIQGQVVYPSVSWHKTFRGIVHGYKGLRGMN